MGLTGHGELGIRWFEVPPDRWSPDREKEHASRIAIDNLTGCGSELKFQASLRGKDHRMSRAPLESRHQNFLPLLSRIEGARQAMDGRRREINMIHGIEHERGPGRNVPQGREKGTELASAPISVQNDPRASWNPFSKLAGVVSQDDDRREKAGAVLDRDFERVLSAEGGERASPFEARRRSGGEQNGIDIWKFHRQRKKGDYRSPWSTSPATRKYFVSCLYEPENGFRIGTLRSCSSPSPSRSNPTGG